MAPATPPAETSHHGMWGGEPLDTEDCICSSVSRVGGILLLTWSGHPSCTIYLLVPSYMGTGLEWFCLELNSQQQYSENKPRMCTGVSTVGSFHVFILLPHLSYPLVLYACTLSLTLSDSHTYTTRILSLTQTCVKIMYINVVASSHVSARALV